MSDFITRIAKYEEIYEPITDRVMHYIKLTDMCVRVCTGSGGEGGRGVVVLTTKLTDMCMCAPRRAERGERRGGGRGEREGGGGGGAFGAADRVMHCIKS